MPAIHFSYIVDAADIWMRKLAGDSDFGKKPLTANGIFRQGRRKEFQRHRLAQLQIVRPINFPHSTASEQPDNTIAVSKNGSRCESASGNRV